MSNKNKLKTKIMLPNGLKLFIADIVDENTGIQEIWYFVDETYDSALETFIEWANDMWDRYAYYFYEADDDTVENFLSYHVDENGIVENVEAGIYDN